jgi:hypothetical protein
VLWRGATVRTGGNGRVRLARGEESITILPRTNATIAESSAANMETTIRMKSGIADFVVKSKSRNHFSVETDRLVAVVKGTRFRVIVTGLSTQVIVQEGRVQVTALKTSQASDVLPGQFATSDQNSSGALTVTGKAKLPKTSNSKSGKKSGQSTTSTGSSSASTRGNRDNGRGRPN